MLEDLISPLNPNLFDGPYFFLAIVCGLIMALALEVLLTSLSVAVGISAVGDLREPSDSDGPHNDVSAGGEHRTLGRRLSHAYGAWATVTSAIAVFVAAMLASTISLNSSETLGAIIGLTIWGLFLIVLLIIDVRIVSSTISGLLKLATSGVRTAAGAVGRVFSRGETHKVEKMTRHAAHQIRREFLGRHDVADFHRDLKKLIRNLDETHVDPREVRKEMEKLLDETELQLVATDYDPSTDRPQITASLERNKGLSRQHRQRVADATHQTLSTLREEHNSDKRNADTWSDSALRIAGLSRESAEKYRTKVEDHLRNTNRDELNPDGIKADIEKLIDDPEMGKESLRWRLSQFDRESLVAILAQREDIDEDKAREWIDWIMETVGYRKDQLREEGREKRESIIARITDTAATVMATPRRLDEIQHDVREILAEHRGDDETLIHQLRTLDRATLREIIQASRSDMTEEDAELLLQRLESTRDDMVKRVEEARDEVARRAEAAKKEAINQAEEGRRISSTAAWWSFAAALVSAVAAVFGGMIGVIDV